MNIVNRNQSIYFNINAYVSALKIEPALCKFASIILAKKEIKEACDQNRLVTWLNNEMTQVTDLYPLLGLTNQSLLNAIKEKINIARQYAKILERYVPDEKGNINQAFNYFQLVSVIKKVFKQHIQKNGDLFTIGFQVCIDAAKFFAKVESGQIFMFSAKNRLIGDGTFGLVGEVYEIALGQLMAVKWASDHPLAIDQINQEISVLRDIHLLADFMDSDVEEIQASPLATFSLKDFNGFLGLEYGVDLDTWNMGLHSNERRIAICKSLVQAYSKKLKLGYWHGDLKPENILMNGKGVVIIDWAGSIPFHEAVQMIKAPSSISAIYTDSLGLRKRDLIEEKYKASGLSDELKTDFLQTAESMELFSLAMVLFFILVPVRPFYLVVDEDYDVNFPLTCYGIKKESMDLLLEKKYSNEIVRTIEKMLAHQPEDRYLTEQVIEIWKTIK